MYIQRAIVLILFLVLLTPLEWISGGQVASALSQDYYVSPSGSDISGDGSLANPWQTIQKAANGREPGDTVYIREGLYRETIVPTQSGSIGNPITFRSYPGETATIVGTEPVMGWTQHEGDIYKASISLPLGSGNQIFAGSELLLEARWPNNTGTLMKQTYAFMDTGTPTTVTSRNLPPGIDPVGARIWFRGGSGWAGLDSTVTAYDAASGKMTMNAVGSTGSHYDARAGNAFYLWGKKEFLDAPGEWWYDEAEETLYMWAPGGGEPQMVEAKFRTLSFDLSDLSYIEVIDLHTRVGSIATDAHSSHLLLKEMNMTYLSHQSVNKDGRPNAIDKGIQLNGSNHTIQSSELAYSSSNLVTLSGSGHTIINSHLHDGSYNGTWGGLITASGTEHYIGYNTMERAGRDVLNLGGVTKSIVEHNDLSLGGMVCFDTAMIYTPNTDGMHTEIRYNTIHDIDQDAHLGMGIYLDNSSSEFLIHHNVIWNVPHSDPIRLNSPSNYNLVYNNTIGPNTQPFSTAGARFAGDLFGIRIFNNLIHAGINYPATAYGYAAGNNLSVSAGLDPGYIDAARADFRLASNSPAIDMGMVVPGITDGYIGNAPDIGAYEWGKAAFRTGSDFRDEPIPNRSLSDIPYRNLVVNYGFETLELSPWQVVSGSVQALNAGTGAWTSETADSRFQKGAMLLRDSDAEVEQVVTGLQPDTTYTFSIWSKTSDNTVSAEFGVRNHGADTVTASAYGTPWKQTTFNFKTGPSSDSATIFVRRIKQESEVVTPNLHQLDITNIGIADTTAVYDVTSFIQEEQAGDGVASLIVKAHLPTAAKRITFSSSKSSIVANRPALIISYADSTTQTLIATEDTLTKSAAGSEATNYGNSASLNVSYWHANFIENMYLKFDLSTLSAHSPIATATLRLRAGGRSSQDEVSTAVFGLDDDSWQASTLTWNNRPLEITPSDATVYIDDVGLILPLDAIRPEDEIRDKLIRARELVVQYDGIASASVIDDLEQTIADTITLINGTYNQIDLIGALAVLTEKINALQPRMTLLTLIEQIQNKVNSAAEGTLDGQFIVGSKVELQAVIDDAETIAYSALSDVMTIEATYHALAAAEARFEQKVVLTPVPDLERVDFGAMLTNTNDWSIPFVADSGYAKFSGAISKYKNTIANKVISLELLYHYVDAAEWPGIVLRSQHATLPVLGSGDTSYFLIFKRNQWELQKRVGGVQTLFRSYPHTQLNDGVPTRLDIGAIDVVGGVRIFCYVDGVRVFDFIDTLNPIVSNGYLGFVGQGAKSDFIRARATTVPTAVLAAPAQSDANDEFTADLRIGSVTDSVYSYAFDLVYDSTLLQLADLTPLLPDMTVSVNDDGQGFATITVSPSSPSPTTVTDGLSWLRLHFETKTITNGTFTTLQMPRFEFVGTSDTYYATTYASKVWINVDRPRP